MTAPPTDTDSSTAAGTAAGRASVLGSPGWFHNRVAVVTGGSRGIGAATVALLTEMGAKVAVLDRDPDTSSQDQTLTLTCDITDRASVENAFAAVVAEVGEVSVLVNNAGINANFDPTAMSDTEWDTVFATDLRGAWICSQQALRAMSHTAGAAIVNVSSIHARLTLEGFFPYGAAKAALEGLTRSLALEVGKHGIRVNAVAPGYTNTRLVAQWLAEQERSGGPSAETLAAQHALRRIAEPGEVANAICFLASDAASAITGATLAVDCGLSIRFAS